MKVTTSERPRERPRRVRGLWRLLTTAPGERPPAVERRSRLLLSILVCLILVALIGLLLVPVQLSLVDEPAARRDIAVMYPLLYGGFLATLLVAYLLARFGRHGIAGASVALLAMAGSFASVVATGDELGLVTIGLGPLLAGMLLSWRATLALAAVATAAMLSVPPLVPALTYLRVSSSFIVMLALGALSVVSAILRDRDLAQIERQTRKIVEDQEQLMGARKMEAIARLAAGVAHEFNNIMSAVMGYAEVITMKPAEPIPYAQKIQEAGRRAHRLTEHLLSFSRQQLLRRTAVSLNALVSGRAARVDHPVVLDLGPEPSATMLDRELVGQALETVMARSARQANPSGRVAVHTADAVVPQGDLSLPAGAYRVVTVSDDGPPRDVEIIQSVFDPFFTTGEFGTGDLDLAAAYGIISQSGGHLAVLPVPGGGNTFVIHLPQQGDPAQQ